MQEAASDVRIRVTATGTIGRFDDDTGRVSDGCSLTGRKIQLRSFSKCCGVGHENEEGQHRAELRSFEQAPEWMRRKDILRGYRVRYSVPLIFRSLFHIHNETGNIWTHLLGTLFFAYCLWEELVGFRKIPKELEDEIDHFWLLLYLGSAAACMLVSSAYHLFLCHSKSIHQCMLKLDMHGIILLVFSHFLPGFYYGFSCHPNLQRVYTRAISIVIAATLTFANVPVFRKMQHFSIILQFLIAGIVLSSVIPIVHWTSIRPRAEVQRMLPGVLQMLMLYGIGFFFFSSRFPERAAPGRFDFVFSSHQIWHVCVFAAAVVWWREIWDVIEYRHVKGCS